MRILHTSDWHLGRLFHGASRRAEQEGALARIVELVGEADIDLVIVAGDLYDRAIPPADAIELFDATLSGIHRAGAAVVAISGNHDSAVRVGYADRLLALAGVTVRGDLRRAAEPVELTARDGGAPVVVYPVPFLDPHLVRAEVAGQSDESASTGRFTHHDAMAWAVERARRDLAARPESRSVLVAHTFVNGAAPSESERELTLGNVERVDLGLFAGFDYVALGHLHQSQVCQDDRVAYSGTPLAYSFSEQHHVKSVRIVDLPPTGPRTVEVVPLDVGRPLRTLTGELDHLLTDRSLASAEDAWVRAVLTDAHLPMQAMRSLQQRFPHAIECRHRPPALAEVDTGATSSGDPRQVDPLELSLRFLTDQASAPADERAQDLLVAAFDSVRAEQRA